MSESRKSKYPYNSFVHNENDFVGMIAYALYKKSKIAWYDEVAGEGREVPDEVYELMLKASQSATEVTRFRTSATLLFKEASKQFYGETEDRLLPIFEKKIQENLKNHTAVITNKIDALDPKIDEKFKRNRDRYGKGLGQNILGSFLWAVLLIIFWFITSSDDKQEEVKQKLQEKATEVFGGKKTQKPDSTSVNPSTK